ncbi:MAG: P-loop containing nucleoside triphosphate hydrolase protein [Linnemannia gamsii]|nr:MAG: P-loop containing nucleoside triphosphate hydrolase protein [Linnemannia gamsii]
MSGQLNKAQTIVQHILRLLPLPRRCPPGGKRVAGGPLFVGISGPQGIGKTTITRELVSTLSNSPHNLRVLSFSMDDLYLPFKSQEALSQRYSDNKLIEFRGLPGTHDLILGANTFQALYEASQPHASNTVVPVPVYDKALHAGRGDQLPQDQWPRAQGPFDVILFEGWSLGFKSVRDPKRLAEIYTSAPQYLSQHPFSSIEMVNQALEEYEREWYSYLDGFVHLSAPNLSTVFKWRAEQEEGLWATRGTGMTHDQVKDFVARFMPAYEVYLDRLKQENLFRYEQGEAQSLPSYQGRHLRVDLNEDREMHSTTLLDS